MLNLDQYSSLGAALREALDHYANETCLIEADRERENTRLTYSDFKDLALPLARALEDAEFAPGDRAAMIMSNQSKWLVSAYAIFHCGGVLVPLDYKLTSAEQLELLAHSKSKFLVIEYYLWRALSEAPQYKSQEIPTVLVTEAPPSADLGAAHRWEDFRRTGDPGFVPRTREQTACIVYSSGTGGRAKACVLTHENYLEQCKALASWFPFWPGVRYLSILPTNHAIDFMVGFIGPFVCGACVVHLRTLRPEYVRDALVRYKITYVSLVPLVLKNLERGLRAKFEALPPTRRFLLNRMVAVNRFFTGWKPDVRLSRILLPQVHKAFGGELRAIFTGGAFMDPSTLQFFYDLGVPVANGYGLTEAGTVLTLNDLKPFRPDTVGRPLPGVELRILSPDSEAVGEVAVRSKTVMSYYLDDPELTAQTIVDGWLLTGDLGRIDGTGHLQLVGRKKNMIVTEGGKNIYPEDIESAFEGLAVKEYCIFSANYIWPMKSLGKDLLILVLRPEPDEESSETVKQAVASRNRQLPDFKRVSGYIIWNQDFPRTASMKIKREVLAREISKALGGAAVVEL
jgi:long-chain acyl-CoA synthetase